MGKSGAALAQSAGVVAGMECHVRGRSYVASFHPSENLYTVDGQPTDWYSLPDGAKRQVQRAVASFINRGQ